MKPSSSESLQVAVLTFRLGAQRYAAPIADVVEVAPMVELVSQPGAGPEFLGVANRHGAVLPMLDLRVAFNQPVIPPDSSTLFIVVAHAGQQAGLLVDEVLQVEHIRIDDLPDAPAAGRFIRGILSHKSGLLQIVSVPALLAALLPAGIADQQFLEGEGS